MRKDLWDGRCWSEWLQGFLKLILLGKCSPGVGSLAREARGPDPYGRRDAGNGWTEGNAKIEGMVLWAGHGRDVHVTVFLLG